MANRLSGWLIQGTIFFLFLGAEILCSQTWIRVMEGSSGHELAIRDIQPTRDGGFIGAGNVGERDAWVLRLDRFGEVEWQYEYGTEEDQEVATSIIQTNDGGFIFTGTRNWFVDNRDVAMNLWIVKLDPLGTVVWQKEYDIGSSQIGSGLIQTETGYMVVASGYYGLWVLSLDPFGIPIWQRRYDITSSAYLFSPDSIVSAGDDGYFLAATIGCATFEQFVCTLGVVKIDMEGMVDWSKSYYSLGGLDYAWDFSATRDGGFIALGSYWIWAYAMRDYIGDVAIGRYDENGSLIWSTYLRGKNHVQGVGVAEMEEGFLLAGNTARVTDVSYSSWDGYLALLNHDGELVWDREYSYGDEQIFLSMSPDRADGVVLSGSIDISSGSVFRPWLLRLNDEGMVNGNCSLIQSVSIESNFSAREGIEMAVDPVDTDAVVTDTDAVRIPTNLTTALECEGKWRSHERPAPRPE